MHLIPWDLDNAFENILGPANEVTPIPDAWGETSNNCEPFEFGSIDQRSAACDKLTATWASFTQEYEAQKALLLAGPMAQSSVEAQIDAWAAQIRAATAEASAAHDDAITMADWEAAVERLKTELDFVRANF